MNQEFDLRKSVRRTNSVSFHGIFFGGFARLPSGQAIHSKRLQLSFAISKSADSSNLYILFLENVSVNFFIFFSFFFSLPFPREIYLYISLYFRGGEDFFYSIFATKTKMEIEDFFFVLANSKKRF